jgi:pimeloyl-ACP methyl ester carboxylesterase
MDVNSIEKSGALNRMAARIAAISRRFGEKAIIIGYSQGNAVALKLLQRASV